MVSQGKVVGALFLALVFLAGLGGAVAYGEATFSFNNAFATGPTEALIGESQFFMDVLDETARQVLLRIRNTGPTASSITGVFLEDQGGLLDPMLSGVQPRVVTGSGVLFLQTAETPDLVVDQFFAPFIVTPGLTLTAIDPVAVNGINPGESLDVLTSLTDDIVTSQLMNRLETGAIRVALLAEGFPQGGTAIFINDTSPMVVPVPPDGTPAGPGVIVIPAPGAILLGAMGAGLVGWLRRRRTLA